MENYSRRVLVDRGFDETVSWITKALEAADFVVTPVADLGSLLRRRLGPQAKPYVILDVCDLSLAASVVDVDPDLAVCVPYTLAIHELDSGQTVVTVAEHLEAIISRHWWRQEHPVHRDTVAAAIEAEERFGRVLASITRPEPMAAARA